MAGYATPEVRALFEEWAAALENEVVAVVKEQCQVSPADIAQRLKISEDSALYFISKAIRDKKIKIAALSPAD